MTLRRPKLETILALLFGLAAIIAATPVPAARSEPDAATKARLAHLLVQDCGSCHGLTLQGGLGKPLLPETLADRSADILAEIILDGIPGTPMPPWRGLLSRDEALHIADLLKKGPTP
ncbi:MAG: cytochrome c [Siculibacillus sp.]